MDDTHSITQAQVPDDEAHDALRFPYPCCDM